MKRILMITSDYEPAYGGIGIHVKYLMKELIERGYSITLLVARMKVNENYEYSSDKYYQETYNTPELKVVEINTNFSKVLSKEEQVLLENLEEKEQFDYYTAVINQFFIKGAISYLDSSEDEYEIIHLHDAFVSLGAVLLKKYLNLSMVVTMHSMNSGADWMIDNVRRYLVNNTEKIVCVSDFIRNEIIKRFQFKDDNRIVTIHNSVNVMEYKRETPIEENGEIVFCGRLEKIKGVDLLIQAVGQMPEKYKKKIKVTIIGKGDETEELKKQCREFKIENKVNFTGFINQKEVFQYYDKAMCVVLPSRKEAFATTALEAMSRGCCVLSSNTGGFTEMIKDEENGFLFQKEDVESLKRKLVYIFENMNLVNKVSKKAQETVLEYSWKNAGQKICDVYKKVKRKI